MSNNKSFIALLIVCMLCGCNHNSPKHKLKVTDSVIYWDSMQLVNESP